MCGIIGVFNLTNQQPIDPTQLRKANNTLAHRGPDDAGIYVETNIGLAMRRLSIIDLADGQQPMSNEDGTVHIVYNGETYNHLDLHQELESLGHQFRTHCDTEAVLHAYEEWGIEGCLARLRGMYAFAIWDSRRQTLHLARDRMGIKPLYYAEYKGRLYFASEIKGMLHHSQMPRRVNLAALDAFMTVGFVSNPHSLFKGVQKLPPAHYLTVENGLLFTHNYWQPLYREAEARSEADLIEEFYALLRESVMMRLMSEVPLGALLSGGIDSTILTAIMQREAQNPVKTISIGFEIGEDDETQQILANARALKTNHSHTNFTGQTMDEYPKALRYMEEPLADAIFVTFYNLYRVCKAQGLTVVLNGEGADELLGGYYWHRGERWARPLLRWPAFARNWLAQSRIVRARGEAGTRLGYALRAGALSVNQRYQNWLSIGAPGAGKRLLSAEIKVALARNNALPVLDTWADYAFAAGGQSELNQMLWLQAQTRLIDRSNHMVDRMSMAHSVEARVPFLDHKLWELGARLPQRLKMGGSYLKPIEKYILREAGRNLVPEATRRRKKKGLTAPYANWLAQPRLPDWAETALSAAQLKKTGLFDPAAVLKLRREHQAGAPDKATLLMAVVAVQTWWHLFLERP